MKSIFSVVLIYLTSYSLCYSQYPGPAGTPGSTAIHKDSSILINWAESAVFELGPEDISNPDSPVVSVGEESMVLGPADIAGVVSLGDGGSAVLSFDPPITDGPGFDFAVFENAFSEGFLELAFVEVSSDGDYFERFDAISLHTDSVQFGPFSQDLKAEYLNNLAGKYKQGFGTPFDLSELDDHPSLDKDQIRYVRIIDVVGSINPMYGTTDSEGNYINDPFPTPFPSSGFDLDAVGVINQLVSTDNVFAGQVYSKVFPNPVSEYAVLEAGARLMNGSVHGVLSIRSIDGVEVELVKGYILGEEFNVSKLQPGVYLYCFNNGNQQFTGRFIRQ